MTMRYTLAEMLHDLLEFAAKHLQSGGRLCYWLPVFRSQYVTGTARVLGCTSPCFCGCTLLPAER
jgi:tRNA G10  N-methylase Trm11